MLDKIYVIAGPTASGKTAIAINLAKKINGEIISADSMQVYKTMDIGTAKPTLAEMDGIRHHLLDVAEPDETFSVAQFQTLANDAITGIIARNKTPIVAGGTGFYINALLYGTNFNETDDAQDAHLRNQYMLLAQTKGAKYIHDILKSLDPEAAKTNHPNNIKRVVRAISYCEHTGTLFSEYNAIQKQKQLIYDTDFFVLNMNRERLYTRIHDRVDAMMQAGLIDEVSSLLNNGYTSELQSMQGIGYKELIHYLQGDGTLDDAILTIKQHTRNYAKRQVTWFKHQVKNAKSINVDDLSMDEIITKINEESLCSTNICKKT